MLNILRTQLFKLKKSKAFWVLLALCAALPILGILLLLGIGGLFDSIEGVGSFWDILGMAFDAQSSMTALVAYSSDSALMAMIFSAIILSREFTQGTVRNTILANKTRKQIFFAYFLTALIVGTSYFLVEYVTKLVLYGSIFGFGGLGIGDATTAMLCYFAMGLCAVLVAESCMCAFLFCTRKQSLTIVLPLLICLLVPSIVAGITELIVVASSMNGNIPSETVLQCLPFYNMQEAVLNIDLPAGLNVGMIVLYDLVIAAAFFTMGFFAIKKADLK